jgi:hypothetical protein
MGTDLRVVQSAVTHDDRSGHRGEHRNRDDPLDLILILVKERCDGDESVPERIALLAMGDCDRNRGADRTDLHSGPLVRA